MKFTVPKPSASILKSIVIGVAFIGLVGWNVKLQAQRSNDKVYVAKEDNVDSRGKRSLDGSQGSDLGPLGRGGAVYARWGKTTCPDDGTEIVYSGIVGATHYNEIGGSSEYICLSRDPQFERYTDAVDGTAKIYGVEFQVGTTNFFDSSEAPSGKLEDADVVCSVCRSTARASQVMIPGRKECPSGWNREYWGYLMTAHFGHKAQHNYACVDNTPEADEKGSRNDNGGLMYHVQGVCGSLPCPNYVAGRELTCVVCTK